MKNKKNVVLILLIFVIVLMSCFAFSLMNITNNNIFSGITINNINISNMSKDFSKEFLTTLIEKKNKTELKFEYLSETPDKYYEKSIDLSILNINFDLDKTLGDAYLFGRSGNIIQNNFSIAKALFFKKNFILNFSLDEEMLENIISDISSNLPDRIIQNGYYIENENLVITKGTPGIVVDKELFKKNLYTVISNLSSEQSILEIPIKQANPENINLEKIHSEIYREAKDAYFEKDPFQVYAEVRGVDFNIEEATNLIKSTPDSSEYVIKLQYTNPKVTVKNLDINIFPDKLSSFSTRYDISNKDRSTNLELAASKINNTILAPGEEFSYNKIVGERSIAAGYKEAKIYQNGEIIDGLGGGICQISSTLYNSVVFANLKVTQRFNHQFLTSYVSAGRDATVAYGIKDFKFINNRTYPIKINISVNSGVAKVDIFGIKEKTEYQVDFLVETISDIPYKTKTQVDSSISPGTQKVKQSGSDGIIVNVYKLIKQNGITIAKEFISKDKYNPLDKVILKSGN